MDQTGRNQGETGSGSQWDKTYGKRPPQENNAYALQNTHCGEWNQPARQQEFTVAEQISSFGPLVQPYLPAARKPGKGLYIALGSILALLFLCAGLGWISHISSPSYRIKKGFENMDKAWARLRDPLTEKMGTDEIAGMMAKDGGHVKTRLNLTTDTYMGDITLGVDTDFYKDVCNKELDASTSISVMNYDFAHFNLYANDEVFCFSIPELQLEDLYIETEDVKGQFNRSVWRDVFGPMEEEYSMDFFPDRELSEPVHGWQDLRNCLGQYSEHLEQCLQNVSMEKAGKEKGIYRVTFDKLDVNFLLRDLILSYEEMTGQDMYELLSCLQLVSMGEDISFLLEIDGSNRIRKIMLENPVSMFDNRITVEGELLFESEEQNMERIRGHFITTNEYDDAMEFIWQSDRGLSWNGEEYWEEINAKCGLRGEDDWLNLKYTLESDSYDGFEMSLSMKDDWSVYVMEAGGCVEDIRQGESYKLKLDEATMTVDGERLFKIDGSVVVEPLNGRIKRSAKDKKAFFKISMEEWEDILYEIIDGVESMSELMP